MKKIVIIVALVCGAWQQADAQYVSKVWVSDQKDGTYINPIIHADYSDPDVCAVGDDFYMTRTTGYRTEFAPHETDFRERIHPKKDFALEDTEFSPQPYYQVFQERLGFLPNLSIIDLLFNMGPESLLILQKSIT